MALLDMRGVRLMVALDRNGVRSRPASILHIDAPRPMKTLRRMNEAGVSLEGAVETVQSRPEGGFRLQQFLNPNGNVLALRAIVARDTPVSARGADVAPTRQPHPGSSSSSRLLRRKVEPDL